MSTLLCSGSGSVFAQALPGGTLDPTTIPKYVTPLVIPPVMKHSGRQQGPNPSGLAVGQEYDIAVRQFKQQILPGGVWNTITGRNDKYPATTIWSYGPATDPAPDSSAIGGAAGVAPAPNSQFNYPAYTVENLKDTRTTVNWINDLVDDNGNALPHLFPVDQSLHWANPIADCKGMELRTDCMGVSDQPYLGPVPMVSHVHGAHVSAAADGYTEAWWLPDANNISCVPRDASTGTLATKPTGYDEASNTWNVACEGNIANKLTDRGGVVVDNVNNPDFAQNTQGYTGSAFYEYQNDQPSATLWYHDHSLGMTRLNVYAGPAGFWLVRDGTAVGGETGLMVGTILPGPAPAAGEDLVKTNFPTAMGGARETYREIPIVIQDRSFNADGSLFYPDNRAFFEGLNVAGSDASGGQFGTGTGELQIDMNPATSDIAPIWNPEAFFNTMVVNGTTWPVQEVAPALYRFRLLNGTNSRFLNLALIVTDANGAPISANKTVARYEDDGRSKKPGVLAVSELRFWQIGAEQSLKPTVTAIRTGFATNGLVPKLSNGAFGAETPASDPMQALLMGPAERSDSIVDFRGLPNGTIITMTNTAPDAPFGGFPDVPADPATTGQVMRFVVNTALAGTSPTDHIYASGMNEKQRITYIDPFGNTRSMKNDKQAMSAVINGATAATDPWKIGVSAGALANFTTAPVTATPRELALIEEESTSICVDAVGLNLVQLPAFTPVGGACQDAAGNVHPTALPMAPKAAVLGTMDAAGLPTVTLWSDPVTTNIASNTAEQWNISNTTVDGHPIHVHLVGFKVLGRSTIGGGPSLNVTAPGGLQPWEDGWKDTVITYPGEVTSIAANFDINGLYVWHCHILEHEDNEMMVPMCVGTAGVDCPSEVF